MKTFFLCLLAANQCLAAQDIFSFTDVAGFEKCMRVEGLEEVATADGGAQKRYVHGNEVRQRCLEGAVALLKSEKKKAVIEEFLKTAKRTANPEYSIGLAETLVRASQATCNDMLVYDVILKTLSHPWDGAEPIADTSKRVIKYCLKDKEFKKDFLEEKDNANSYIKTNACDVLKAEKLVSTCGKG
jgi:hypothetical protein